MYSVDYIGGHNEKIFSGVAVKKYAISESFLSGNTTQKIAIQHYLTLLSGSYIGSPSIFRNSTTYCIATIQLTGEALRSSQSKFNFLNMIFSTIKKRHFWRK